MEWRDPVVYRSFEKSTFRVQIYPSSMIYDDEIIAYLQFKNGYDAICESSSIPLYLYMSYAPFSPDS